MASQTLPRLGWLASHALKWLSWWIGHYEACALLDAYRVFLLDREGFDRFLPPSPRRSLLDVGVGTGDVHLELAPLFEHAKATEIAYCAWRRACARGINCLQVDLSRCFWPWEERFDLVALLNVLDRSERPLTLLQRSIQLVAPRGHLLIAMPLPYRPYVDRPRGGADPEEWLPIDGNDFQSSVVSFLDFLESLNLMVLRWARLPYLSSGDWWEAKYVHDDVLVLVALR